MTPALKLTPRPKTLTPPQPYPHPHTLPLTLDLAEIYILLLYRLRTWCCSLVRALARTSGERLGGGRVGVCGGVYGGGK